MLVKLFIGDKIRECSYSLMASILTLLFFWSENHLSMDFILCKTWSKNCCSEKSPEKHSHKSYFHKVYNNWIANKSKIIKTLRWKIFQNL